MKIVLLPGLDGTGELFKPLIEALPEALSVKVIPYPPDKMLSYSALMDFVLEQLPEEEFILVGESFSGYIAYQIACDKPKHLKAVIFVASFLENPRPKLLGLLRWLPLRLILSISPPSFIMKQFLLGWTVDTRVIKSFQLAMAKVSPAILAFRLAEICRIPASESRCEVRGTYLQAENDYLVPELSVEKFKEVFDTFSVVQIKGAHFLLQTHPQACAKIIAKEAAF